MNIGKQAKLNYLVALGYEVTTLPDGSGTLAINDEQDITILFSSNKMEASTPKGSFALEGWMNLDIELFKIIALAFGLVPMSEQEKSRMASLVGNYEVKFTNQLS